MTLKPHASVPAPPAKPTMTLAVYLSNSADPAQSKQAVLGSRAILGLGNNASVIPRNTGCNQLPDGRASKYCWSLNWVQFESADNGTPLLFPGAQPGNKTYVVEVPYGAVVDLVLINPGAMVHPMHLHGQRFWVLGAGNGQILTPGGAVDYSKLNSGRAIMRDTQPVANAIPAAADTGSEPQEGFKGPAGGVAQPAAAAPSKRDATAGVHGAHGATRNLLQGMGGMPGMQPPPEPAAVPAPASGSTPARPLTAEGVGAMAPADPTQQQVTEGPQAASAAGGMEGMAGMGQPAAPAAAGGDSIPPSNGAAGMAPAMTGMGADAASLSPGYAVVRFKATNPGEGGWEARLLVTSAQLSSLKVLVATTWSA